jgi:hypothetical protein
MKLTRFLIGPELYWLIIFAISFCLSWLNRKPNYDYDSIIENAWIYIPLLTMLLFGMYQIAVIDKKWHLLRIWISSILMGHFTLNTLLAAYSTQGPGIGMGYLTGILIIFIVLIGASILVKIFTKF